MIIISGASDDLIEITGDVEQEFPAYADSPNYLGFSDGTVLHIWFDRAGIWRITPIYVDHSRVKIDHCNGTDEGYSDTATIDATVRWVVYGKELAIADQL